MIVVRIELWPLGDSRDLRQLDVATITNVGGDEFGEYEVRRGSQRTTVTHRRADGAWRLAALALAGLDASEAAHGLLVARPEEEIATSGPSGFEIHKAALSPWALSFFEAGRDMRDETDGLAGTDAIRTRVMRLVAAGVFRIDVETPQGGVVRLSREVLELLRLGEFPFLHPAYQEAMRSDDPARVSGWIADSLRELRRSSRRRNHARDIFGRRV